jgi:hypothetical protein
MEMGRLSDSCGADFSLQFHDRFAERLAQDGMRDDHELQQLKVSILEKEMRKMKRRILLTMLGLGLTLGQSGLFAGGSCGTCRSTSLNNPARPEPWNGDVWLLISSFVITFRDFVI